MKIISLSFFLCFAVSLHAQIKVASVLGDNMVLQRNSEVKIWGISAPNDKLIVSVGWDKSKISAVSNDKGEWVAKVKTVDAGGPYNISISNSKQKITVKNILLGEVWLCSGQSNMEMPMAGLTDSAINGANEALFDADNTNIRLFTVEKTSNNISQDSCGGKWLAANSESAREFSAIGYFFAKRLQKKLNVPVGIICSAFGGTRIEAWMSLDYMKKFPEPFRAATEQKNPLPHKPAVLYNAMINPIKNYVIKGALWYQGESNREWPEHYAALMGGLVESWRNAFGIGQFPFYFVQIAPYSEKNSNDILSAKFRDEQLKASLTIPNCGMVSTIDLGEENNIHPAEKEIIAKRLANWAISEAYGVKGIAYKNTYFKSIEVNDSTIEITFENIGNGLLKLDGKEVSNFEIAGEDKVFYPAKAVFRPLTHITLSAKEVKKPIAVRYCYHNYPLGKVFLYNQSGLPVPSFRSDNW